ncbi:hypothetical protein AB0J80_27640 [Actinoplanes sp. NPDC049548]
MSHSRVPTRDGSGAECLWVWQVQASALRRLGIEPPEQTALEPPHDN